MIAAQDEEIFWIFDLVGKEKADNLEGLFASIDVVAKEEVIGLGGEEINAPKSKKTRNKQYLWLRNTIHKPRSKNKTRMLSPPP
jgi:hypothetical protein